jgi:(E)-4-hydroxy-3-methylbut-2-enyl-diphosphate synthase
MKIKVGDITIGGDFIPIQTMIKNPLRQVDLTIEKIKNLYQIGCDIIRVAVPDKNSIPYIKKIVNKSPIPIVADIHFDYQLAIMASECGVQKIRINPGNIGDEKHIKKVIDCAKEKNIPIRIGINAGSLSKNLIEKYNNDHIKIMIESAKEELKYFKKNHYHNVVLSFKSSNVMETIQINQIAKKMFPYPLHIGVTEAGDVFDGVIKNTAALSVLLNQKIGDTIRVSLTGKEDEEIIAAKQILESLAIRKALLNVISCPTCSRTETDIVKIVRLLKQNINIKKIKKPLKIAVMGCIVNGPGESKEADFGVACGKQQSIIFKNGKKLKLIKNDQILDELIIMTEQYYD